jgi:hypothetical protein
MDIYKIGMSITLANGVSSVLAIIAKDMFMLEGGVKKLQSAMTGLNKTSLLVGGALGVVVGGGIIAGFAKLTDHAKELSHQLVQIKKLGVDAGDFDKYREAAYKAHSQVPGATSVDALKTLGMTHSMFGVEGSIKALKPILEFAQALGNSSGDYEKATEQVKEMVRAGELSGQFVNESTHKVDVDKLLKFLDLGQKVNAATHGMVNPHTWLMMAQQGGPMLGTMSEEGMLTMAMVGQAMGGPRAGTAIQAVGRQFLGFKMTTPTADALDSIGFMKQDMYTDKMGRLRNKYTTNKGLWSKEGGPFSETGAEFARTTQEDPLKASMILLKALNEHGYKTMKEIVPMLYQILGTDTARRLEHELVRNAPQMFDEKGRIKQGMGVGAANKVQNAEDYEQVLHNYEAAKNEMLMHVGLPLMQTAIPVLKKITEFFDWLGNFAKEHPDDIAKVGAAIAALGAVFLTAGVLAIFSAIAAGGWLVVGLPALAAGIAAFWEPIKATVGFNWEILKTGFAMVVNGIKSLAGAFEWFKEKVGGLFSHTSLDGGGGSGGAQLIRASLGGGGAANDNVVTRAMRSGAGGASVPGHIGGMLNMGGASYAFGSGGAGNSIPAGDYPITPGSIGAWGAAHGAIGINNNAIWDSSLGRFRRGIELHAGHSSRLITEGCIAIAREQWPAFRAHVLSIIRQQGSAYLHVGKDGVNIVGGHSSVRPYSKPHHAPPQSIQVNLDGEVIHRSVVKHARRATEHSHQAPTFDGHHDYSAPDGQIWAA